MAVEILENENLQQKKDLILFMFGKHRHE